MEVASCQVSEHRVRSSPAIGDVLFFVRFQEPLWRVVHHMIFSAIGMDQDGLVHISQLAGRFTKDLNEVGKVHQRVMVVVVQVDLERKRITLTMRSNPVPQSDQGLWRQAGIGPWQITRPSGPTTKPAGEYRLVVRRVTAGAT